MEDHGLEKEELYDAQITGEESISSRDNGEIAEHMPEVQPAIEGSPAVPVLDQKGSSGEKLGLLELIYGTLFDPVITFKKVAAQLPVGQATLLFSLSKILSMVVLWFAITSGALYADGLAGVDKFSILKIIRAMVPLIIAGTLVYEYIKWFVYSGTLHLLADLAGGSGRASGVLVATGLASLPSLLFLPVQIITTIFRGNPISGLINFVVMLTVLIWGLILVVIGLRETQRLSTGAAVLVTLVPAGIIIITVLIFSVMAISMLIPMVK